jgi:hypothetical protein
MSSVCTISGASGWCIYMHASMSRTKSYRGMILISRCVSLGLLRIKQKQTNPKKKKKTFFIIFFFFYRLDRNESLQLHHPLMTCLYCVDGWSLFVGLTRIDGGIYYCVKIGYEEGKSSPKNGLILLSYCHVGKHLNILEGWEQKPDRHNQDLNPQPLQEHALPKTCLCKMKYTLSQTTHK